MSSTPSPSISSLSSQYRDRENIIDDWEEGEEEETETLSIEEMEEEQKIHLAGENPGTKTLSGRKRKR